ncbi:MAG: undecaprenyl/decaprenyl-phosphate alpha-N-acetylglucosaminyl 1-phosphate transferase [Alphaproteobacteria bacterium]|nr:undecaprenyl/decaprenyl-phosphate alpha-N-acetylglucosaminyl 1-phosphate transferase [Alphaproteobacteria bacterium]
MFAPGLLYPLGLAAALLSALLVRAMIAARILDQPNARSSHSAPTPRGGGVGVVAALVGGLGVLHALGPGPVFEADGRAASFAAGVVIVAALGLWDDLRGMRFAAKLLVQLAAAAVAMAGDLVLTHVSLPGFGQVALGALAWPFTALWLVGLTNAMNFIDGLNGLCAGVCLIAAAFLAVIAQGHDAAFVQAAALMLAAGCMGFLPFNFPRARIFLGDVGSQALGFAFAALGVWLARGHGGAAAASFWVVPALFAAFLFDTAFTILRRALAGERVTEAHRGHLYQVASRAGMPPARVSLIHFGFALLQGNAALLLARGAEVGAAGPALALAPLLAVQFAWLAVVRARAARVGLDRW